MIAKKEIVEKIPIIALRYPKALYFPLVRIKTGFTWDIPRIEKDTISVIDTMKL
jgi:hypothetical protein